VKSVESVLYKVGRESTVGRIFVKQAGFNCLELNSEGVMDDESIVTQDVTGVGRDESNMERDGG